MPSKAPIEATHQHEANAKTLFVESLGIPVECILRPLTTKITKLCQIPSVITLAREEMVVFQATATAELTLALLQSLLLMLMV
jgi:hypothetical protein